jgi:hypothetical protein
MISGANEKELENANDRADLLLEIDKLKDINFKQEYELENRMIKIDYLQSQISKIKEAIELDLSFAKSALKMETNPDSTKSINDLIKYDENLLKILDGKSD